MNKWKKRFCMFLFFQKCHYMPFFSLLITVFVFFASYIQLFSEFFIRCYYLWNWVYQVSSISFWKRITVKNIARWSRTFKKNMNHKWIVQILVNCFLLLNTKIMVFAWVIFWIIFIWVQALFTSKQGCSLLLRLSRLNQNKKDS